MKWIGQHIYDLVARFRDDVYLEDISSGTIASGGNLGLDSNNKIVKQSDTGITDLHGAGVDGSANQLLTDDGDGTVTSEANLTFDGSTFSIEADSNTTANGLFIDANALTTGSAINLDIDDALTASATKSLMLIDYDKAGDTASGQTSSTTGLDINMADTATDNVGTILMTGVGVTVDSADADGTVRQTGVSVICTDGDASLTRGYYSEVEDGGFDIFAVSSANTSDYATWQTTTNGATTIATTDVSHALAHFEVAADGNITLDAAGDIALEAAGNDITADCDTFKLNSSTADYPIIKIENYTDDDQAGRIVFDKRRDDDAVASGQNLGEIWFRGQDSAQNTEDYAYIISEIDVGTSGQESGKLQFGVAAHDGTSRVAATFTGGSEAAEVDATIASGAASVTTIAGTLTMGSTAALTNAGLVAVANQSNITGLGTISSGVWNGTAIATAYIADDAVTFAKASGVSPKIYGSVIKLIPSDFMDNGDGGNQKFGVAYTDVAGTGYGMRPPNNATELYAFVSIPEGMKATHVDIYDKNDLAIEVFEVQINATTMTSKGSGNCNTTLDITDVNSTATNFLAIEVTTTSVNDRIYGGTVTIAAQ